MYEKNNAIFAQFPLVIFGAFLSFFGAQFSGGSIGLVPQMLKRSSVNFNSRRISDSGKTVS